MWNISKFIMEKLLENRYAIENYIKSTLENLLLDYIIFPIESSFEQNQKNTTHAFFDLYLITIVLYS